MIQQSRASRTRSARLALVALVGLVLPHSAHAAGGLELVPDVTILIGLIVLFLMLVFPVNALLFKPIFRVLDEREERIAGTRSRAQQLEDSAHEALERYQSSVQAVRDEAEQQRRSLLESARSEALAATGEARSEVEGRLDGARSEIAASLESARVTLRSQSQEIAREAASRVLGRAL